MVINIWSDVRCPFCYIGKRKFEAALKLFEHSEQVVLDWHSFELDPELKTLPGKTIYDYMAKKKGMPLRQSVQVHKQIAQTAKEVGLLLHFDKVVVTGSFDAHRLIQLSKKYNLADMAEETLFRACFTDGMDISDHETLLKLGVEIGLMPEAVDEMLRSDAYAAEVRRDESIAQSVGVTGVPFFVINTEYSISGAQDPATFLKALQQAWKQYETLKDEL